LGAEAYASYQKLVPNVSAKVDEFMKAELSRLVDQTPPPFFEAGHVACLSESSFAFPQEC
jgi:hypothetical protein